ncbi:pyrimidine reductase family protein [Glycomyces xiaoerkulensis]|uniref:pyrimidine reductase family protein n=1 Tax=Glycomyces xiaoerkulensis TaxID=2038139 RepID=UPI001E6265D1|nr:pyrimidine reductase family protein [Glycomyces xiaoerkulensis]
MPEVLYRRLDELSDAEVYEAYEPPEPDWLRVNFVASADGAATLGGLSGPLSGAADKRVFKALRARCDVLVAGSGTVLAERYRELRLSRERVRWRLERGLPEVPVMAVLSRSAGLDPDAPLFTEAPRRPIVICSGASSEDQMASLREVADVIAVGAGAIDYRAALAALRERGLRQVLCEGGPTVLGHLIAEDMVDELDVTVSPMLVGAGPIRIAEGPASEAARRMRLHHVFEAEGNLILRYLRGSSND